jgi:hypothetical protein
MGGVGDSLPLHINLLRIECSYISHRLEKINYSAGRFSFHETSIDRSKQDK